MMLGMLTLPAFCPTGNSTRACALAMATLQIGSEALIDGQRMVVAANMETIR
jgi:hypothetical protein